MTTTPDYGAEPAPGHTPDPKLVARNTAWLVSQAIAEQSPEVAAECALQVAHVLAGHPLCPAAPAHTDQAEQPTPEAAPEASEAAGNWDFLREELAVVRAELARVDGKCSTLAGLASAGLAFLVTQIGAAGPMAAALYGAAGAVLAAAALILLAGVLRPRLGDSGFCQYAAMPAENIRALGASDIDEYIVTIPADLHFLSVLAAGKQRRLRIAVDLIAAAVVLMAVGLAAGALT